MLRSMAASSNAVSSPDSFFCSHSRSGEICQRSTAITGIAVTQTMLWEREIRLRAEGAARVFQPLFRAPG